MQDVETYEEISARSKRVLQRVSEIKKTLIDTLIIVTHQGWTDHVIVDKFGKE
jgi:broad specificity phosphatase PhoE